MKGSGFSVQSSAALVTQDRQRLMEGAADGRQWSQAGRGRVQGRGVGHLLVREYASDAAIGGGEHGQEAVPEGNRGEVTGLSPVGHGQGPCAHPSLRPPQAGWCLRVKILVPPHALHQLLCDACVQDQVVQKEVVA